MGGRGTNGFTGMFTGTALEWDAPGRQPNIKSKRLYYELDYHGLFEGTTPAHGLRSRETIQTLSGKLQS